LQVDRTLRELQARASTLGLVWRFGGGGVLVLFSDDHAIP